MPDIFEENSEIECLEALVITRKISHSSIVDHEKLGISWLYKCQRNSSAKIIKPIKGTKKALINNFGVNLSIDDNIKGSDLMLYTQGMKKFKITKAANQTGTHSAQTFYTKTYTYAILTKAFSNIPALKE